jgi:hypothetical protein
MKRYNSNNSDKLIPLIDKLIRANCWIKADALQGNYGEYSFDADAYYLHITSRDGNTMEFECIPAYYVDTYEYSYLDELPPSDYVSPDSSPIYNWVFPDTANVYSYDDFWDMLAASDDVFEQGYSDEYGTGYGE